MNLRLVGKGAISLALGMMILIVACTSTSAPLPKKYINIIAIDTETIIVGTSKQHSEIIWRIHGSKQELIVLTINTEKAYMMLSVGCHSYNPDHLQSALRWADAHELPFIFHKEAESLCVASGL